MGELDKHEDGKLGVWQALAEKLEHLLGQDAQRPEQVEQLRRHASQQQVDGDSIRALECVHTCQGEGGRQAVSVRAAAAQTAMV